MPNAVSITSASMTSRVISTAYDTCHPGSRIRLTTNAAISGGFSLRQV